MNYSFNCNASKHYAYIYFVDEVSAIFFGHFIYNVLFK